MIYRDNAYTTNIADWKQIGAVYIAQSETTDYAKLGAALDIVVDYDLPEGVESVPCLGSGGSFDPRENASKSAVAQQDKAIKNMADRQEQALKDGAVPKVEEVIKPKVDDDSVGNDLDADPLEI